jgi:hypothetical protein
MSSEVPNIRASLQQKLHVIGPTDYTAKNRDLKAQLVRMDDMDRAGFK